MCGTDYTVEEVMRRVLREKPFFERSGGGLTVSGGECLSQPGFTLEVLKSCRQEGIHTAVDTSGYVKWEIIESIMPYTDLFLYDIKGIDSTLHELTVGVPNELILDNARKIAAAGGRFQMRIPVVPGYSDSAEVFDSIGKFILELGDCVDVVQILPYHTLGTVKWERLGTLDDASIYEAEPPAEELLQERKKQLEAMGLKVIVH